MVGGDGDNQLFAGNGGDLLIGGNATLEGGQWVPTYSTGNDIMHGGDGADLMIAAPGITGAEMFAGSGNDTLVGGNGSNVIVAGVGSDLLLGGNMGNTMIGSTAETAGNATMVGGSGIDTILGGNGNETIFADASTLQAQGYWARAIDAGLANFNVLLTPPVNPLASATTPTTEAGIAAQLLAEDQQLQPRLTQLRSLETQYTNANLPVPSDLKTEYTDLTNQDDSILEERIQLNNLLNVVYGSGTPIYASLVLGGSGQDMIYGGAKPDLLGGGQNGSTTFFLTLRDVESDTLVGGSGGENTVIFEDTPGQENAITLTNTSSSSTLVLTLNSQPAQTANISNIQNIGADLLGTNDTATMTISQKPTLNGIDEGLDVYCGSGIDTIDEQGVSAQAQSAAVTIYGGSGNDDVKIDSDLPSPPVFSYPSAIVPGISELDISGSGAAGLNMSIVSRSIDLPNDITFKASGFDTVSVYGVSSPSAAITNTMTTDGTIPNVVFRGGDGTEVTNDLKATGGTTELIAGSGGINNLTATSGSDELIGNSGLNTFNASGATGSGGDALVGGTGTNIFEVGASGTYTVSGNPGTTNELVISGDTQGDEIVLGQDGPTILVSNYVILPGGQLSWEMTATATDITGVDVVGGSGNDYLKAAGMSMGVTLDGGGGTDTLVGGSGNDTLIYGGADDVYNGGGGTDNEIAFMANPSDDITVLLDHPTGDTFAFDVNGVEDDLATTNIEQMEFLGKPSVIGEGVGDSTFLNSNWPSTTKYSTANLDSAGVSQSLTGGDPGSYLTGTDVTQGYEVQYGSLARWYDYFEQDFYFSNYSFNPGSQGAISGLSPSFDITIPSSSAYSLNGAPDPPSIGLMIQQSGTDYDSNVLFTPTVGSGWVQYSADSPVTAADFSSDTNGSQPNFSASGAPIYFGFDVQVYDFGLAVNKAPGDPAKFPVNTFTWGIDNFSVQVDNDSPQQSVWPIAPFPVAAATATATGTSASPIVELSAPFTDKNVGASIGTDVATINWGDGSTSSGVVTGGVSGNFNVTGNHIYAANNTYQITVSLVDPTGGSASQSTTYTGGLALEINGDLVNYYNGSGSSPVDNGVQSFLVRNADSTIFSLHAGGGVLDATTASSETKIDSNVESIFLSAVGYVYDLRFNGSLFYYTLGSSATLSASTEGPAQMILSDDAGGTVIGQSLASNGAISTVGTGVLYLLTGNAGLNEPGWVYSLSGSSGWLLDEQNVRSMVVDNNGWSVDIIDNSGMEYQLDGYSGTSTFLASQLKCLRLSNVYLDRRRNVRRHGGALGSPPRSAGARL